MERRHADLIPDEIDIRSLEAEEFARSQSSDDIDQIQASKAKDPILKATSIKAIAKDPDPRSGKAIVDALSDEHPLVRAASYDALARRGDTAVLPDLSSGLNDKDMEVKLTAAAPVAYLSTISNKAGQ